MRAWLAYLGLAQYSPQFALARVTGAMLPDITLRFLAEEMGMRASAHRLLLMAAIDNLIEREGVFAGIHC